MSVRILTGDCRDVLKTLPDASVDSIVTDPPYGLEFMGVAWDTFRDGPKGDKRTRNEWGDFGSREHARHPSQVGRIKRKKGVAFQKFTEEWAIQCLRVLKPGGHLLSFSGPRTYHRMVVAIEDAGFEIRDQIMWVYGSGFPKSLNVSKAIDKAAGAERTLIATGKAVKRMIPGADQNAMGSWIKDNGREFVPTTTAPATDDARQWQGWGTALKPAMEPICVARKPLIGTVAQNVLKHGTGALNIDGCRVEPDGSRPLRVLDAKDTNNNTCAGRMDGGSLAGGSKAAGETTLGRWPANLIHDGSEEVLAGFPETGVSSGGRVSDSKLFVGMRAQPEIDTGFGDSGSAARFFYTAKADAADRGIGNNHPTVKPTVLMAYLCRLVTPPGGIVLDPFMGSGSTLLAADREGFDAIGIELNPVYAEMARRRILDDSPLFAEVA